MLRVKLKAHDVMMLMKKIPPKGIPKKPAQLLPEPELIGFSKAELKKYFA